MAKERAPAEQELPALPMKVFVSAAPFFAGLFYEPYCALASLCLIGWLVYCCKRRGAFRLRPGPELLATAAVALFYAASALWAVDRGMAPVGFIKFLPLPLFVLSCGFLSSEQRRGLLEPLPYCAALMVVLSLLLGAIPALRDYFYVNRRLAGFFQYPNTFALYALLGIPVLVSQEKWGAPELVCLIVLLAGIVLSGSRTVTVLLAFVVILYAFLLKGKRRIVLGAGLVLMLTAAAVFARLTGDVSSAGRYLTTSAGSSTLLGRLLYFRDALPVIVRHPFGLGYLGYWYTQGSFQTGVYSVMHIHNDLLQFLLDVGWVPAGLLVWIVLRGFRRGDLTRRVMIGVMTAHLLLDFDMQFAAMDILLLAAIDQRPGRRTVRLSGAALLAAGGVLAAACLYFGAASALYYTGNTAACAAVCPGYTPAQTELLTEADSVEVMGDIAEEILSHNDSVAIAWNARARIAYSEGDMGRMIECKKRAISLDKYTLEEYLDYADYLSVGLRMYTEAGDTASASVCRGELRAIPAMLDAVRDGTSALGWRITDQPSLELPASYSWLLELP